MAKNPLGYDERRYSVPVFDFNPIDSNSEAQLADDNESAHINIKYEVWSQGDPELRVTYINEQTTRRYNFRVTDTEMLECSYKGDDPSTIPPEIQHAVSDFGYNIKHCNEVNHYQIKLSEALSISSHIAEMHTTFEDELLFDWLFRDAIQIYETTIAVLTARTLLCENEFETFWSKLEKDFKDIDSEKYILHDELYQKLEQFIGDLPEGLELGPWGLDLQYKTFTRQKETSKGLYTFTDYATPLGVVRFRFRHTGKETVVCEYPDTPYIPSPVGLSLKTEGYEIKNRKSIAHKNKQDPISMFNHASNYASWISDDDLTPNDSSLPSNFPAPAANVTDMLNASIVPYQLNPTISSKVLNTIYNHFEITSIDQFSPHIGDEVVSLYAANLPRELQYEWMEYVEENPEYKEQVMPELPDA